MWAFQKHCNYLFILHNNVLSRTSLDIIYIC